MSEDVEDKGKHPLTVPRKGTRRLGVKRKDVGLRPKIKSLEMIGRSLISRYKETEKKDTQARLASVQFHQIRVIGGEWLVPVRIDLEESGLEWTRLDGLMESAYTKRDYCMSDFFLESGQHMMTSVDYIGHLNGLMLLDHIGQLTTHASIKYWSILVVIYTTRVILH